MEFKSGGGGGRGLNAVNREEPDTPSKRRVGSRSMHTSGQKYACIYHVLNQDTTNQDTTNQDTSGVLLAIPP